jgi:type VI secretion system protein VasJ
MLTDDLASLFGARAPTALARAALAAWEDWLQPIDADAPAGADPVYDDAFQAMREEVAKLSGINDALVLEHAQTLLQHTAKDLRVAAYYVYSRLRRDGARGVAEGMELLAALIDRFGDSVLPARPESRKAAVDWLTGNTFADRLDHVEGLTGELLERTVSAIALIDARTRAWPEAGRPALAPLCARIERLIALPVAPDMAPVTTAATRVAAAVPRAAGPIASSRDLLERTRQMALFLAEQPNGYLAGWRLMRTVRWDMLDDMPPHDAGGTTRLQAPRTELRTHLKRLLQQKHWTELLERVEAAFAEGANHFWLDLQYYAYVAHEHVDADGDTVREAMAMDCQRLLERLPGVEHLTFADGEPFADATTRAWFARLATLYAATGHDTRSPAASDADIDWTQIEAHALAQATQEGLDAAFARLVALPQVQTARQRFLRQFVMARVAEHHDRPDLALHLLSELDTTAARHGLARWEPTLAFDVKTHLLRALTVRMNRKDADKRTLAQRIETLRATMTTIDPVRATSFS